MELNQPELIRDFPASIRPISRLGTLGVEALKDAELLTLVLRSRSMRAADELLTHYKFKDLVGMTYAHLSSLHGVGPVGGATLLAAAEIFRRSEGRVEPGVPLLQTVNDVAAQAIDIRDKKKEYLLAFFLNARHQLISKEIISIGTLTASLAHPREIYAPAIGKAAAGVILVHNHPSGDPSPSDEDSRLTKRITQAGIIMGIELLDHVIVSATGSYSFKSAGAL